MGRGPNQSPLGDTVYIVDHVKSVDSADKLDNVNSVDMLEKDRSAMERPIQVLGSEVK